ncbi:hypothetical protein HNV12_23475 [Methanococcoides sp. SA1]|uniref:hypothetical protein n=1 Tax=unclassified Lentimicrobium TaxID=2677434 RepID=UPI001553082F|nr:MULTISPECIES: hypothetical protein [unclassified Lentimicrobium]NPD48130.1 hypothetical protein [Lentimicrobium sp. S6]NPD86931.1 hypothetical protein [Lentimicrobium sp. L6]NPE30859.1 hypothetical protein [Methanococcoides sp. SA1]
MKAIVQLTIFLFTPFLIFAQGNFGKSFCVGSSFTFLRYYEDEPGLPRYNEYTWNVNVAMQITKRLDLGVQAMAIFMKPEGGPSENHHIIGVFGQFNFIKKEKIKVFVETSFNTGNYKLSRNDFYPSYENGIVYIGFGGGVELKISKRIPHLFLDLSFINYEQLNIDESYAYTQYVIGLNYRFGKGLI